MRTGQGAPFTMTTSPMNSGIQKGWIAGVRRRAVEARIVLISCAACCPTAVRPEKLSIRIELPVLEGCFDLVCAGRQVPGFLPRGPEEIEGGHAAIDVGAGRAEGVIVEPQGPGLLLVYILVDRLTGSGIAEGIEIGAPRPVRGEPLLRAAVEAGKGLRAMKVHRGRR